MSPNINVYYHSLLCLINVIGIATGRLDEVRLLMVATMLRLTFLSPCSQFLEIWTMWTAM